MTSGTKTVNLRYSAQAPWQRCLTSGVSLVNVGSYYTKTWSGGNAPTNSPKPYQRFTYEYNIYVPRYNKKGKQVGMRTIRRRRRVKVYYQGLRTPKGNHNYTCNIYSAFDTVFRVDDPLSVCQNGRSVFDHVSTETYATSWKQNQDYYWPPSLDFALIGKLSNRINGETFNMGVFLGEGKEALGTIAEGATRIRKALSSVRKGNLAAAAKYLFLDPKSHTSRPSVRNTARNDVAGQWLQLQYGWLPMVEDVFNAAGHFAYMQNRPQILRYRAKKERRTAAQVSESSSVERIIGETYVAKRIIANVSKINEIANLGLTDPASVAWELMPYSFVIDWFIPIGNYLAALNLQRSLTAEYVTTLYMRGSFTGVSLGGVGSHAVGTGYMDHRLIKVVRTVSSSLAIPLPKVKPWVEISSFKRAANAVALLTQKIL